MLSVSKQKPDGQLCPLLLWEGGNLAPRDNPLEAASNSGNLPLYRVSQKYEIGILFYKLDTFFARILVPFMY